SERLERCQIGGNSNQLQQPRSEAPERFYLQLHGAAYRSLPCDPPVAIQQQAGQRENKEGHGSWLWSGARSVSDRVTRCHYLAASNRIIGSSLRQGSRLRDGLGIGQLFLRSFIDTDKGSVAGQQLVSDSEIRNLPLQFGILVNDFIRLQGSHFFVRPERAQRGI